MAKFKLTIVSTKVSMETWQERVFFQKVEDRCVTFLLDACQVLLKCVFIKPFKHTMCIYSRDQHICVYSITEILQVT